MGEMQLAGKSSDDLSKLSPANQRAVIIEQLKPALKAALPRHMDVGQFARTVITAVRMTPKLAQCSKHSLLGAVLECAQLGLEPNTPLGHAHLIPYMMKVPGSRRREMTCRLMIGYKGFIELCQRSGRLLKIKGGVVYQGDEFEWEEGTSGFIRHRPSFSVERLERPMECAYAIAYLWHDRLQDAPEWVMDKLVDFEVMGVAEIELARSQGSGAQPAWKMWEGEMAKKVVMKRLMKRLPKSREVAHAIHLDNQYHTDRQQDFDFSLAEEAGVEIEAEGPSETGGDELDQLANEL